MTDPTLADTPEEQSLADVLHLLVDHGRLPDEGTARRAHEAIERYFADTSPLAESESTEDTDKDEVLT